MTRPGLRTAGGLSSLAFAALMLAFPAGVAATTNAPIAQTGGMTATLPILGAPVSVTVALDPSGNITGVTVSDPSLAQTSSTPEVVKFANTGGTTKVTVRAMGSRLAISAKVTTLAELIGSGTWSADVFGTGSKSNATYTIGDDGSGNPTISLGTPTGGPSGVTWKAAAPKAGSDDGEAWASAGGTFSYQGFDKQLRITVKVDKEDGYARLSITLAGRDVQVLTGSLSDLAAAGVRTWSAHLCDGTAVTVKYHVNPDGTIGYDGATGAAATATPTEHGLAVRFDGTAVGLMVTLKSNEDGTYTLVARGFSGSCDKPASKGKGKGHEFGQWRRGSEGQPVGWGDGSGGDGQGSFGFGGGDH